MRSHARLAQALHPEAVLHFNAPSLPDPLARQAWCELVRDRTGQSLDPSLDWTELILGVRMDGPVTLVFDNVSALADAYRGWTREVGAAWSRLRTGSEPVHLVLVDGDARLFDSLREPGGDFRHPSEALRPELAGPPGTWLDLAGGDYGVVARACPDWSANDVVLGWTLLGGTDDVLDHLDPTVRAATNVRRLLLSPSGGLHDLPLRRLRARFQSLPRYASILRSLALGGQEWKDLVKGLESEISANAIAPYVGRLRDFGLVEDLVSLDAPARSRRRRYRATDPLQDFWWAEVAPRRDALLDGRLDADTVWTSLRSALSGIVFGKARRVLEDALRHYSAQLWSSPPREIGGLWGDSYDIGVATTLANGAIVYGDAARSAGSVERTFLRVEDGLRFTRYGYGRENRMRVILAPEEPDPDTMRRIRRDRLRRVVTFDEAVDWARKAASPPGQSVAVP